jgi:hypothetical protein
MARGALHSLGDLRHAQVLLHEVVRFFRVTGTDGAVNLAVHFSGFTHVGGAFDCLAASVVERGGDGFNNRGKNGIARGLRDDAVKHQIVDEIFGRAAHGGEHVGNFFSEGGELLLLAALGGQSGEMAFKDDTCLKHLPGLKAVQRADEREGCGSELRRAVGDKSADTVANLHDAHGGHITDAGAQAGATDFEGPSKLALGRYLVAGQQSSALDEGADVVNHLHRAMSIRLFFFHPRHKTRNPLAILKINVTGRLSPKAEVWLEKLPEVAEGSASRPADCVSVYTSGLTSHSASGLVTRRARRLEW